MFVLYALNLLLAAGFTASGAVLHMTDPLPQHATLLWRFFLMTCVSTPILLPVIAAFALYPRMSALPSALCGLWIVFMSTIHAVLALGDVDLSMWLTPPPPMAFAGHVFDGQSIGGKAYGQAFDLLSSIPCMKGEGLFIHASLFTLAAMGCLVLCLPAAFGAQGSELCRTSVRRLTGAVAIMVFGQLTMIPLLVMVGVQYTLDLWHVSIFVVMATAYVSLRELVCAPASTARHTKVE